MWILNVKYTHIVALRQGNTQIRALTSTKTTSNIQFKRNTHEGCEKMHLFILITTTKRKLGCIAFMPTCIQATTHAQNMIQQISHLIANPKNINFHTILNIH